MQGGFDAIEIVVLAALAAFIVWKLYGMLGRKTGHENTSRPVETPHHRREQVRHEDNGPAGMGQSEANNSGGGNISDVAPVGSPLAAKLTEIQLADRSFDPQSFIAGAKQAYEMIVTAYAAGDRATLKPLLSADVYEGFEAAIADRESRGETVEFQFIGISTAEVTDAELEDRTAEITVKFISEVITVTKNSDGAVIDGDPTAVRQTIDTWTFARDTRSSDPSWELIGTDG